MFEAHFQTFDEPETGIALFARLSAFREELAKRNLSGFVIPRADQQQNEYVPPSDERLAWLTGFTGSAGQAIVLMQAAPGVVDGLPPPPPAKRLTAACARAGAERVAVDSNPLASVGPERPPPPLGPVSVHGP